MLPFEFDLASQKHFHNADFGKTDCNLVLIAIACLTRLLT